MRRRRYLLYRLPVLTVGLIRMRFSQKKKQFKQQYNPVYA